MRYGLMKGIGKGLSQGAGIVQQGLADDRAAELQKLRDESIERRWKAESASRDKQRSEDVAFREGQAKTSANQFDRQQTSRDKQTIESNLNSILDQQNKEELAIRKHYEKISSDSNISLSPEQKKALESEMINAITSVRSAYDERLQNMVGSYGDKLKGTGFEYLLSEPDPVNEASTKIPEPIKAPDEIGGLIGSITNSQATAPKVTQQPQVESQDLTLSNLLKKWGSQTTLPEGRTKEMSKGFVPRQF